ncbi:phage holin family protein [Wenzhouxiangella sp. EGI_FJ10305]|uniref:phage holin family protein n=1 Tax=Wenzhouxiangella sp. EGI_FJ10305 TaxID=3243768 RepID=UPI0035E011ED
MPRDSGDRSDYDATSSSRRSGHESGLLEVVRLLDREVREVVYDHLFLAALEARQAGESLVRIIAMGLITACLLSTAWLALVSAVVIVLVQHSLMTATSALMLVFAVHCLVAMLLVAAIRKRSRHLMFPATISRLEPAPSSDPDGERSP